MRKKETTDERLDKMFEVFEYLWWDYHLRFHKGDDNNSGHHACVEWPCVYIEDALR